MQTYYYVLASQSFLIEEEPLEEVLRERTHYHEREKKNDFGWSSNLPSWKHLKWQRLKLNAPSHLLLLFPPIRIYYLAKTSIRVRTTGNFRLCR